MLFDDYDRIRIVNLPYRKDRRSEMKRQLAKVGLLDDPRVAFFDAISCGTNGVFRRKGSHGAFLSHLSILREAAWAKESILILQDDCDFIFPQVLTYEMPPCDIFYGGYFASDPQNPRDSDIIGAHFMGFSLRAASVAVRYLTRYLEPDFEPDKRAAAEAGFDPTTRPPIDGAFVWMRRAHPELVTEFAMLGVQRPSRTDIGDQRWFDRTPLVRSLAGVARRLLRQTRHTQPSVHTQWAKPRD